MNKTNFASILNEPHLSDLITQLAHHTVMVTGATGLIGAQLVGLLAYANQARDLNIRIICHARDKKKMEQCFHDAPRKDLMVFLYGDIGKDEIIYPGPVDYIVHTAAPTASKTFVENPTKVIEAIVQGTANLLQFASVLPIRKFVYLSTMEVYGISVDDLKRTEDDYAYLDHLALRSSYPESKKMAETMCMAWFHEKQVPVSIGRLTQTFGFGVPYHDQRVFAQFARCLVEKKDIVLHTTGETKRNYLYIGDALSAIVTLLVTGVPGEAYNVANDEIYLSIWEMANLIADHFGNGAIKVEVDAVSNDKDFGYAPALKMNLSTEKLRLLGWYPTRGILEMYASMIEYWNLNGKG